MNEQRAGFLFPDGACSGAGPQESPRASQWPPADPHSCTPKSASLASLRPQPRFRQGFSDAPGLFPPRDSLISAGCARSPPRASEHTRAAAAAASLAAQFARSFPVPSASLSLPLSRLSFPPPPHPARSSPSFSPAFLPLHREAKISPAPVAAWARPCPVSLTGPVS